MEKIAFAFCSPIKGDFLERGGNAMPHDVLDVAKEFLGRSRRDGISIDPLKLQKLVYLAHGWNLALTDNPLIENDVEAWKWGPVVRKLYREYRQFRANPIQRPPEAIAGSELTPLADIMVESIWKAYQTYSPIQLSMLTHEPGSAWDITRKTSPDLDSPVIPTALIRDEFLRRKQHAGRLE